MLEKREGEPCPKCRTPLMRRCANNFQTIVGDVAFCVSCRASFELVEAYDDDLLMPAPQAG